MKQIKFRTYHKKERRFYYFDLETVTHTWYVGYHHPITAEKDCELDDYSLYSEKQLYTGLKDKNSKEIYEGDILLTPGKQKIPVEIYDIAEGDAKFRNIGMTNCEVIGNIYENPSLLEEVK